jgi:hypothetical protein
VALALNARFAADPAELLDEVGQVAGYAVAAGGRGAYWQGPDVLADNHEHRGAMHALLGRDEPRLGGRVDHRGDLQDGVERVLGCHDAAGRCGSGIFPVAACLMRCCIIP